MPEDRELLERELQRVHVPAFTVDGFHGTRERRIRNRQIRVGIVAVLVAALGVLAAARAFPREHVPADQNNGVGLGIFEPYAGRILARNTADDFGGWVDPNGPVDTMQGPGIAEEVYASVVQSDVDGTPMGWSSDGTEMLVMRSVGDGLFAKQTLWILHADGSETEVTAEPIFSITDAGLSPDGSLVWITGEGDLDDSTIYTIHATGGRPVPLRVQRNVGSFGVSPDTRVSSPVFSPDGSRIAFVSERTLYHAIDVHWEGPSIWTANVDGTDARQIGLRDNLNRGVDALAWSTWDKLAMEIDGSIYSVNLDGTDFTKVAVGSAPYWSPDGSRIAYTIPCLDDPTFTCAQYDPTSGLEPPGLAIAKQDGSDVRAFGYGASGPWFPSD